MTTRPIAEVTCPRCQALNTEGSTSCFLCDTALPARPIDFPGAKSDAHPGPGSGPRFHLSTMSLVIALIAVFLGLCMAAPGLAVPMLLPGGIALVRSITISSTRHGQIPTPFDRAWSFMATFSVVVMVIIATGIAFFATCLAACAVASNSGSQNDGVVPAFVIGTIAALAVASGLTFWIVRNLRTRDR